MGLFPQAKHPQGSSCGSRCQTPSFSRLNHVLLAPTSFCLSIINGQPGLLPRLVTGRNTAGTNTGGQPSLEHPAFNSFGCTPKCVTAGYGGSTFNTLGKLLFNK